MNKIEAKGLHDKLLAAQPEGARHDADICSFCIEDTSSVQAAPVPPGPESARTEPESTEGGTTKAMSDNDTKTIAYDTHEALLEKALRENSSASEAELAQRATEIETLKNEVASLTEEKAELETDNARINASLDKAQLELKAATDEVAALKQEKADAEEAARKADIASARAEQIRNLGLFEETFIEERASRWAELDQAAWDERVEEWGNARKGEASADTASAMSGGNGDLAQEVAPDNTQESARRAALAI